MGGKRGRLISTTDRQSIIKLVKEAVKSGARKDKACKIAGISIRTYQRWVNPSTPDEDQRPLAEQKPPKNKLTPEEEKAVLKTANLERFKSLPPSQIVPALADEGKYMASESTFYRVLKKHGEYFV